MSLSELNKLKNDIGEAINSVIQGVKKKGYMPEKHYLVFSSPRKSLRCVGLGAELSKGDEIILILQADDFNRTPTGKRWNKIIEETAKCLEKKGIYERIQKEFSTRKQLQFKKPDRTVEGKDGK